MEKIIETLEQPNPHTRVAKPKLPPALKFYGNHNLNFEDNDIDTVEYYAITELRKIPIPNEILLAVYDSLVRLFKHGNISKFTEIENWCPVSFPPQGVRNFPKQNVVTFGPLGMHLVITPHHIKLPTVLYELADWYTPLNKETVQILRTYYQSVITLFGGDHALYVNEPIFDKYYTYKKQINGSALTAFEQTLKDRYGPNKKPLFSYTPGKYPKYYIDTFTVPACCGMDAAV
jgi:hypothetical protein